jgi:hypothetical protein
LIETIGNWKIQRVATELSPTSKKEREELMIANSTTTGEYNHSPRKFAEQNLSKLNLYKVIDPVKKRNSYAQRQLSVNTRNVLHGRQMPASKDYLPRNSFQHARARSINKKSYLTTVFEKRRPTDNSPLMPDIHVNSLSPHRDDRVDDHGLVKLKDLYYMKL